MLLLENPARKLAHTYIFFFGFEINKNLFSVIVWRHNLVIFHCIWCKKYSLIAIQFFDSLNLFKSIREFSRVKNSFLL